MLTFWASGIDPGILYVHLIFRNISLVLYKVIEDVSFMH